jgi:2-dehydro-3-deoxy-D-arabinonate dehydratase
MIRVFATTEGLVVEKGGSTYLPRELIGFDAIFTANDPVALVNRLIEGTVAVAAPAASSLRAPIENQEVWAAGVTYMRSKTARMEEAKSGGGGDFYDKVYVADRPELFFKATPQRVVGPGAKVRIRSDSKWNVPEPELTLAINAAGRIFGFTVGNDMSSRDIEGENPLYLPQAKVYAASTALGPSLVMDDAPPSKETRIHIAILRGGEEVFSGETDIGQITRPLTSLAEFLFRDNTFPQGAYLMTGTGIVPPDSFTLDRGDEIRITIEPSGTLSNVVA